MAAIRRPEPISGRHRDDGIEEQPCSTDGISEPGGVGFREIALKRRSYDFLDRERRQHQRLTGEGIAVGAYDRAAMLFDLSRELRDVISR